MKLSFVKMHGAGNDFIVVDATTASVNLEREVRRRLADRRVGVGFDQLLLVEAARADEDFYYRIFNADGGEVEQCGNGVRCVARYIHERSLSEKTRLRLGSPGGVLEAELLDNGQVRVNMGEPRLAPPEIPLLADAESVTYAIQVEGETLDLGAVSMGNPHAVLLVPDTDNAPVSILGEMLESHDRFPNRANIGFMQRLDSKHVKLRVFERGVGETLACGTGACAAVVWGVVAGQLDDEVEVQLPGGALVVSWQGRGSPVFLTGPAVTVFEGNITL